MRLFATLTFALGLLAATHVAAQEDRAVMIVYDASGSMWGQLPDGTTKVETARSVLRDYLSAIDPASPLGLVSYGHRRKGDCGDIEVIAEPSASGSGLADRIDTLMPTGKTPLTQSMRLAAETLPQTAEAADIILITDGLETCEADPCALASDLTRMGIDVRAHVVGFGLNEEEAATLACIPEQTGGQLLRPQSGAELTTALTQVTAAVEEQQPVSEPEGAPQAVEVRLLPPEGTQVDRRAITVLATDGQGETIEIPPLTGMSWRGELPPGDYTVRVEAESVTGEARMSVADERVRLELPVEAAPVEVAIVDRGTVRFGARYEPQIDVGSLGGRTYLQAFVFPEGRPTRDQSIESFTIDRTGRKTGPSFSFPTPGRYVISVIQYGSQYGGDLIDDAFVTQLVEVAYDVDVTLSLDTDIVERGQRIPFEWSGSAGVGDMVWFDPDGGTRSERVTRLFLAETGTYEVIAPHEAGDYTFHYGWREDGETVSAASVSLRVVEDLATSQSGETGSGGEAGSANAVSTPAQDEAAAQSSSDAQAPAASPPDRDAASQLRAAIDAGIIDPAILTDDQRAMLDAPEEGEGGPANEEASDTDTSGDQEGAAGSPEMPDEDAESQAMLDMGGGMSEADAKAFLDSMQQFADDLDQVQENVRTAEQERRAADIAALDRAPADLVDVPAGVPYRCEKDRPCAIQFNDGSLSATVLPGWMITPMPDGVLPKVKADIPILHIVASDGTSVITNQAIGDMCEDDARLGTICRIGDRASSPAVTKMLDSLSFARG